MLGLFMELMSKQIPQDATSSEVNNSANSSISMSEKSQICFEVEYGRLIVDREK